MFTLWEQDWALAEEFGNVKDSHNHNKHPYYGFISKNIVKPILDSSFLVDIYMRSPVGEIKVSRDPSCGFRVGTIFKSLISSEPGWCAQK